MPERFDPEILEVLKKVHGEFHEIALKYADYNDECKTLVEVLPIRTTVIPESQKSCYRGCFQNNSGLILK